MLNHFLAELHLNIPQKPPEPGKKSMFVYPASLNRLQNPCSVQPVNKFPTFHEAVCKYFHRIGEKTELVVSLGDVEGASWSLRSLLVACFFYFVLCNSKHQVYPVKGNKPRRGSPAFMWMSSTGSQPRQQASTGWQPLFQRRHTRTSLRLWSNCIFPSQWNGIIREEKATSLIQ